METEPETNKQAGAAGGWRPTARRLGDVMLQPWVLTVVALQVFCWWTYSLRAPIDTLHVPLYALSVLTSAAFWFLLNLGRDALETAGRALLSLVVGTALALVLVGSYRLYMEFGEFMSASMIQYAGRGGSSTFARYIQDYLYFPVNVLFFTSIPVIAAIWQFGPRVDFVPRKRRTTAALVAFGVFAASLAGTSAFSNGRHQTPDSAMLTSSIRSLVMPDRTQLGRPDRQQVPEIEPPSQPPNILLVVNESLGTHEFDTETGRVEHMPYLESWLDREQSRTVSFQRAYANSTSTDVSVPSLFTGVGPEESSERLHTMPLLWHWARSAGLAPFYVSAQNYSSTNFDEFFFEGDPMPVSTPNTIQGGRGGDFAIDELVVASHFDQQLDEMPEDRPFFGVYNSNAMHKPYQQTSPMLEEQPDRGSPYRNAMYILDRAMKKILEGLERRGRLENTLVIVTSDHGEYESSHHRVPRILSTYEEFLRVPLLVRLPKSWRRRNPDRIEGLRANTVRNVSNVDLAPTIVEALGYPEVRAAAGLRKRLSGRSLFEPVPRDRTIVALNNNAIRHWEHKGFGVFWKDWRFVYTDVEGPRLFDISDDPRQQNDRWEQAPTGVREHMLETIRGNPFLAEIWEESRPRHSSGIEPIFR